MLSIARVISRKCLYFIETETSFGELMNYKLKKLHVDTLQSDSE